MSETEASAVEDSQAVTHNDGTDHDGADDDDGALDLLDVAGGAVFKRFIPVAVVGVVVLAIIIWIASR